MLRRSIVGALLVGGLVVVVAPAATAAQSMSGSSPVDVSSCHDVVGGPGGGCPTVDGP
jgi:hypothetical protein